MRVEHSSQKPAAIPKMPCSGTAALMKRGFINIAEGTQWELLLSFNGINFCFWLCCWFALVSWTAPCAGTHRAAPVPHGTSGTAWCARAGISWMLDPAAARPELLPHSAVPEDCEASTHEVQTKVENPKNLLQQVFYLDREELPRRI